MFNYYLSILDPLLNFMKFQRHQLVQNILRLERRGQITQKQICGLYIKSVDDIIEWVLQTRGLDCGGAQSLIELLQNVLISELLKLPRRLLICQIRIKMLGCCTIRIKKSLCWGTILLILPPPLLNLLLKTRNFVVKLSFLKIGWIDFIQILMECKDTCNYK